jgi:hypothetical protein
MLRPPLLLALALILLALACHEPDPQEEARKSIVSWRATVAMLAASWVAQDVPDVYAKLTADKAADNLDKLGSHDAAIARALKEAIEHHDRARAAAIARELRPKS